MIKYKYSKRHISLNATLYGLYNVQMHSTTEKNTIFLAFKKLEKSYMEEIYWSKYKYNKRHNSLNTTILAYIMLKCILYKKKSLYF